MATPNCGWLARARRRNTRAGPRAAARGVWRLGLALWAATILVPVPAEDDPTSRLAKYAREKYLEAQERLRDHPGEAESVWQFGRACFDWAEFATNDDQRAQLANEGIAACRKLIANSPNSVPGHYYLGMNLGQLARTKTLGALKLVNEMEREFLAAQVLDAKFDYAGPDRNLGLLYLQAPGWPTSVGNKSKARTHLQRAVQIRGDHPGNRLCLLEAYAKWKESRNAQRELKAIRELLPAAREKFTGAEWEESWVSWDRRWKAVREKLGENDPAEAAEIKPPRRTSAKPGAAVAPSKPDNSVSGRIASVNPTLRFVVMDFSLRRMPALDQQLNIYRGSQKVGEVKVSGPTLDTTIAGDLVSGEAQIGDEVRED